MNVLVIGANGNIGQKVVRLLANQKNHQVKAMVRKEEQVALLEQLGAEGIVADLETEDGVKKAAAGSDVIIFTAGSGGHTGADKTMLVDLDGAIKSIEAAVEHEVKRFIMVSALHTDQPTLWPEDMKPYFVAKRRADDWLKRSGLNYTILRPGWLTDEAGTGKIEASSHLNKSGSISREDVATVIVETIECERTYRQTIDFISGEKTIREALQSF